MTSVEGACYCLYMTKTMNYETILEDFLSKYMQSSDADDDLMDILRKESGISLSDAEKIIRLRAAWEFEIVWAELIEGKDLEKTDGFVMNWRH